MAASSCISINVSKALKVERGFVNIVQASLTPRYVETAMLPIEQSRVGRNADSQ